MLSCNTLQGDEEEEDEVKGAAGRLIFTLEVGDLGLAEVAAAGFAEALCDGSTIFRMSFFCFSASISSYLVGVEN